MSSLAPKQVVAAQKSGVETTFAILNTAFDGIEKLVELNVQAVKSTLAANQDALSRALSAKGPHELFTHQASQAQPAIEKAQSYWRHVNEILSSTRAGVAALAEARFKQRKDGSRETAKQAGETTESDDNAAAGSAESTAGPATLA